MTSLSNHIKGITIAALGVIAISPDGLLIRLITADPLTITFWRGLLYAIGMLVVLGIYYRGKIGQAMMKTGRPGILLMIFYGTSNLCFIYSITHTSVANTLFIISTTPLFAALISRLIFKQQVALSTWVAIFAAAIGIYIICDAPSFMPEAGWGNLAGLVVAATLAASFTTIEQNRDRDLLPAFVMAGFAVALLLFPWIEVTKTSESDLFYLCIMGLVLLPVANILMFLGPKYIPAPEVGLMMLFESILGPFWVWLALGEYPGNATIVGGSIVLIALCTHSIISIRKNT